MGTIFLGLKADSNRKYFFYIIFSRAIFPASWLSYSLNDIGRKMEAFWGGPGGPGRCQTFAFDPIGALLHASDGPAQQQDLAKCPDSTGTSLCWKTSI